MKKLSQIELKRQLNYCPKTGVFRWKDINKHHLEKNGHAAGCVIKNKKKKYIQIGINGKIYRAHQLAFLYMTGAVPKMIDHRNGNGIDNYWTNLKGCTNNENAQNHKEGLNKSGLPCSALRRKKKRKVYSTNNYKQ